MSDPKDIRRARRVLIVSRSNGISGLGLGIIAVTVSLVAGDAPSTLASLGICTAGTLELLGSVRAARHDPAATHFLVASQAVSLLSVLALVIRLTIALNPATLLEWMPQSYAELIHINYPDPGEAEAWLRTGVRFVLALLALVIALFETGMATFYATTKGVFLRLSTASRNRP